MKTQLAELLYKRHPLIFAERQHSISQSSMGWGFSCGDGWFDLIDVLCERLQFWTDHNKAPQVVAVQVKEKWGLLHFYPRVASEDQRGMIDMAQSMSARICEQCGKPGRVLFAGMLLTRCPEHAPKDAMTHEEFEAVVAAKKTAGKAMDIL